MQSMLEGSCALVNRRLVFADVFEHAHRDRRQVR